MSTTSRRALLGAAGGGAAVAVAARPSLADAALAGPSARATRHPWLLSPRDRHLVGRFSYGVTPALARDVRRAGGARAWFERQLTPSRVRDRPATQLRRWWPSLDRGSAELWRRQDRGIEGGWEVMADYQRWVLLRRMRSRRQVLEVMTELWENHFNVPVNGDAQFTWRVDYGDTIRRHALGSFEGLLQATILHPAMLISLDNVSSTRAHPNENLGRELLELYTVGRVFTESDVKHSARILTGWTADMWRTFHPAYDRSRHARGPVKVLGFRHPNGSSDGRAVAHAYLRYLAHHPSTARRVARLLAVKFVSDDPSPALVRRLARVYLRHGTQIKPVLRALVASSAFARSAGRKVRDPGEDLVASYRALGIRVRRAPATKAGESYAANQLLWQASSIGITPFDWPRPDGQPIDGASWSSPARLIASMQVHQSLAGGWWPVKGATYHRPAQWLPRPAVRFDVLVDHLCQVLLHRRATPRLVKACSQATGVRAHARITAQHDLVKWNMHRLLGTLLDSPEFLTR